jgi:hypothetical protein
MPCVSCLNLGLETCILTKNFCNFLQFLQADARLMPQIGHNHFHIVLQLTITAILNFDAITPEGRTASLNEMEIRDPGNLPSVHWPV